ncbi:MAG: FtsX-like permease family protein [Saccharofermentans sp.]|nr:FtsX-like permease family protein [Saccharofermentans sp.]
MRNTKIIHDVTLKHMKMNKKRTVISTIGIALMVMLLTCVLVGKDTAFKHFTELAAKQSGAYHFAVYDINRDQLETLKSYDEVTETAVTEDLKYTEFVQSGNPNRPFLNVRRYSPEAMDWMNIELADGRLPENSSEIVISESAIEDGSSVKIGDKISCETFTRYWIYTRDNGSTIFHFPFLELPAGEKVELPFNMCYFAPGDEFYNDHEEIHEPTGFSQEMTVVGIIKRPVFEQPGYAWYAAISIVNEEGLQSDTFNALLMTKNVPTNSDFYLRLRELVGDGNYEANNGVLIFSGGSDDASLNFIATAAQVFFVVLIVLISVILIYNVFAISYDERSKYLGMLSSVGATGKQKRSSVYFEAMVLLIPALPAGFLAGLGAVKIAANAAGPISQKLFGFDGSGLLDMNPSLDIRFTSVIAVIVLSVATVLISALIPAHKISKVGPIESIRGTKKASKHKENKNPDRLINGSAAGMLASRFLKNDKSRSFGIIRAVAIFFLTVIVVNYAAMLIIAMVDFKLRDNSIYFSFYKDRRYYIAIEGTEEHFDAEGFMRNMSELEGVSDIALVKDSSFSLYIGEESLSEEYWEDLYEITSLYYAPGTYSVEQFNEEFRYRDTRYAADAGILAVDDELFAKIAEDTDSLSYGEDEMPCIILNEAAISTDSFGIAGQKARDYRYLEMKEPLTVNSGDIIPLYPMCITRVEAEELGYDLSDIIFPEIELDGPAEFRVISKVKSEDVSEYFNGAGDMAIHIIIPLSVAEYVEKINVSQLDSLIFFNCTSDVTLQTLTETAENMEAEGRYAHLFKISGQITEFKDVIAYLVRIVLIIFTGIASAICLLNVYSSISALMVSRRKHIAVLKSMGSTFGQMLSAEIRESLGMLIRSFAVSVPLAALICIWLTKTFVSRFGYFTVVPPVAEASVLLVIIVAAVLLMTVFCLKRENKIDIIEEIKRESI